MNISCILILFLLGAGTTYIASYIFLRRLNYRFSRSWYNLASDGTLGEMTWSQVKLMMDFDPLKENALPKRKIGVWLLVYFLWDVAIAIIGIVILVLLAKATFNICCGIESIPLGQSLLHLVVSAGLPALIVSIAALVFQIRLQARSKNRQDWINSIRKEISALIANFPGPSASREDIKGAAKKALPRIVRLELYLNPSEKVHRGFLEVVRFIYGFGEQSKDFNVRSQLDIPSNRIVSSESVDSTTTIDMELWSLKATRLANILLKREWEQVKHVR